MLELTRRRIRTALVVGLAGAGGIYAGGALAEGEDPPADETMAQVAADAQRAHLYYQELWGGALERARAGELQADVDQDEAARILSEALDPPADVEEANRLEEEMIALTAKLRAAGDLPALNDPTRFDSAGGPVGSEVGSGE
jgi:hypothetical protein